ncbi:MAG: PTS transporter subunit EIIC, partial [Longicatena sp.]
MNSLINEKILPKVMAFINTKGMQALKEGLLFAMPLMIIGSIFLLLAEFPYIPIKDWFASAGITPILNQAYGASFNIMAMVAVVGIAYTYVKNEKYEPLAPGVIALSCYLLL